VWEGGLGRGSGTEISAVAKHVYLSDSQNPVETTQGNVTVGTTDTRSTPDGFGLKAPPPPPPPTTTTSRTIIISAVGCIIFCTGYDYDFPFLKHPSVIIIVLVIIIVIKQ
jgi:hypothetical protein